MEQVSPGPGKLDFIVGDEVYPIRLFAVFNVCKAVHAAAHILYAHDAAQIIHKVRTEPCAVVRIVQADVRGIRLVCSE